MLERAPDRDVGELRRQTSAEGELIGVATFSPGPWFGFNGIQTSVLTRDWLFVIQAGVALTRGHARSTRIAELSDVSWKIRRGGASVALRFQCGGRARRMTSKFEDGLQLAKALEDLVREAAA